jgi:hypothetical protein
MLKMSKIISVEGPLLNTASKFQYYVNIYRTNIVEALTYSVPVY